MSSDGPVAASAPIRQTKGGGTGHLTWGSSHILANVLVALDAEEREARKLAAPQEVAAGTQRLPDGAAAGRSAGKAPKRPQRCVLELGAGTGQLAVTLARAGWRGIWATDGEPAVVRNMKYNVQANRLGHAVRCMKWDWQDSPPSSLELADVDLVIGADLVYYNRAHGMLSSVLRSILTARPPSDPRPPVRALLLCCLRQAYDDGAGQVEHHPSSEGYAGTSMQRFIERELPSQSLVARQLPLPADAFPPSGDASEKGTPSSMGPRSAYQLYEVAVKVA
mmetsp:Transcript_3274/g.9264  ORF Transcript_3274/g.9264 Transcript_3274/m.9264 type:complete len:279 (+) Transcript_3274:62-898(+)